MNEANRAVRERRETWLWKSLRPLEFQRQEIESHFGEGAIGAAIELQLTRFAVAILEQAKADQPTQSLSGVRGFDG